MRAGRNRILVARAETQRHSSQNMLKYLIAGFFALALAFAMQIKPAQANGKVAGAVIAGAIIGGVIAHHAQKNRYYRPYTARNYPAHYRKHRRHHKRPYYPYRPYAGPVLVIPLPFFAW